MYDIPETIDRYFILSLLNGSYSFAGLYSRLVVIRNILDRHLEIVQLELDISLADTKERGKVSFQPTPDSMRLENKLTEAKARSVRLYNLENKRTLKTVNAILETIQSGYSSFVSSIEEFADDPFICDNLNLPEPDLDQFIQELKSLLKVGKCLAIEEHTNQ
tara:strand:+ start:36312 stop:36797 length:486 start_codon:yes stop_codon:yes gene_type:complete